MDNVSGKWALVTGASSGFGVEFAKLLAERKANLVLTARRTEPMERLAEQFRQRHRVNVVVEGINLGVPGAAAELKSRLDRRNIAIDILLNNAGHGLYVDRFNRHDWDGVRELNSADARLLFANGFAGRLTDSPYFVEYEEVDLPWRMVLGYVDGEPVIVRLR